MNKESPLSLNETCHSYNFPSGSISTVSGSEFSLVCEQNSALRNSESTSSGISDLHHECLVTPTSLCAKLQVESEATFYVIGEKRKGIEEIPRGIP